MMGERSLSRGRLAAVFAWRKRVDLAGPAALAAAGIGALFLFPDDLAWLTRIASLCLLVLSLDLLIGYCGILTLGQASLFGAGAYAAGIAAVNGLSDPLALLALGAAAGAAAGLVAGAVILRARHLAQLVLSIAIVQLLHEAANKAYGVTGGADGLSGIAPGPVLGLFAFDFQGRTAYLLALMVVTATFLGLRVITRAPFGLLCRAIKADAVRVEAMGGSIYPTLLKMYVISGLVAGLGGALSAITAGVVALDSVSFELSASALVMLFLGGVGRLYGAITGAVVYLVFEHVIAAASPFHWLLVVGGLLIAVVLVAPGGLIGTIATAVRAKAGSP